MSLGVDFRYFVKLVSTAKGKPLCPIQWSARWDTKRTRDRRYQNGANDTSWLILIHWLLKGVLRHFNCKLVWWHVDCLPYTWHLKHLLINNSPVIFVLKALFACKLAKRTTQLQIAYMLMAWATTKVRVCVVSNKFSWQPSTGGKIYRTDEKYCTVR